jgi:hypothetical protein
VTDTLYVNAPWSELTGIPVMKQPMLSDGRVVLANDGTRGGQMVVWIGTCADEFDRAARDARLTVRRGLADVLAWLGEPVENEPTGDEIWEALTRKANR